MTYEALVLQKSPIVTFGYVLQVTFSLLIVLALIYLTSKYILPRMQVAGKGRLIEVIDRAQLEPQVTTYIIKVYKKQYILAVSNRGLTLVDTLKEGETS